MRLPWPWASPASSRVRPAFHTAGLGCQPGEFAFNPAKPTIHPDNSIFDPDELSYQLGAFTFNSSNPGFQPNPSGLTPDLSDHGLLFP